ncbi:MAG: helix-turn-helix transcriptional regulator [Bacteroidetes bacterium]|nr:helix-turn-helix transcriptional regulator [Bacteroidota bacterium]
MEVLGTKNEILLPQNLRCLRKKMNLSQEELAFRIGLNRGNIASYEKGNAKPKLCNLLKIANLFRISVRDLTQKDLRKAEIYSSVNQQVRELSEDERDILKKQFKKVEELGNVFESIYTCQNYKLQSLKEVPKDLQVLIMNFEQLYDASQALLNNHKDLLQFIKDRQP